MGYRQCLTSIVLALIALPALAQTPKEEVYGVIRRTAGDRVAREVTVSLTSLASNGLDAYTISAQDGRASISASSPVAACRAFYDYLRSACHCQVNWSGENISIPQPLPDYSEHQVSSPVEFRHYYNICTFGYTTAFWDWKRWRKEIDWMALHGINMPLSLNGQDKVWRATFRAFGLPDDSIMKFFSGPAFRPWHWMGNLNGHMGPPTESWLEGQAELEKHILTSERALGMTPVVSGFSGFVPVDFAKYNPSVKLFSPTSWGGFEPTTFVDVRDPMFIKIGKRYIEEYRKEYGDVHYYLCDTFNEQDPQFPEATKLQDLAACGKAVYEAIKEGDPDGVWVMQGWLFFNEQDYWKHPEVEALLSEVPEGKMVILDLATFQFPVWQKQPSVADKGWILNTLHNYGQNTSLDGDLQGYGDTVWTALTSPSKGKLLGMGLTMEGTDQNPVVYELMTDMMWRTEDQGHLDVKEDWLPKYLVSRYGSENEAATKAWNILYASLYRHEGEPPSEWRHRPKLGFYSDPGQLTAQMREATSYLNDAGGALSKDPLYQRDLVDVAKTWLSCLADTYASAAVSAWPDDLKTYQENKAKFLAALNELDEVMACRQEHRLTNWISMARSWGRTDEEKRLMERNARMQVTLWDGKDNILDYASKEWAGLTDDFYVGRWRLFFDALDSVKAKSDLKLPDQRAWEQAWVDSPVPPKESRPTDINHLVSGLLERHTDSPTVDGLLNLKPEDPGIAVGKPVTVSGGTEGGSRPESAVDGKTNGAYWSASPPPVWLKVDLEKIYQVKEIDLFCYHGDERYYQYKLEVSTDDQNWTTVVDGSKNTELSTYKGYRHKFTPVPARYVRVTMLYNSANIGQHIHELRVYGD
jgi:alpha-N-acetylglucosaminidase